MKFKTLAIILTAVSFLLAVYCIIISLRGTGGSWALPAALALTALLNFFNIYNLNKNKGKEE